MSGRLSCEAALIYKSGVAALPFCVISLWIIAAAVQAPVKAPRYIAATGANGARLIPFQPPRTYPTFLSSVRTVFGSARMARRSCPVECHIRSLPHTTPLTYFPTLQQAIPTQMGSGCHLTYYLSSKLPALHPYNQLPDQLDVRCQLTLGRPLLLPEAQRQPRPHPNRQIIEPCLFSNGC